MWPSKKVPVKKSVWIYIYFLYNLFTINSDRTGRYPGIFLLLYILGDGTTHLDFVVRQCLGGGGRDLLE